MQIVIEKFGLSRDIMTVFKYNCREDHYLIGKPFHLCSNEGIWKKLFCCIDKGNLNIFLHLILNNSILLVYDRLPILWPFGSWDFDQGEKTNMLKRIICMNIWFMLYLIWKKNNSWGIWKKNQFADLLIIIIRGVLGFFNIKWALGWYMI